MQRRPVSVTEIQAPSSARECARLRKVLTSIASTTLLDRTAARDMVLAFGEAFSNAVKYGQSGPISVRVEAFTDRELAVEMDYQGAQFNTDITYPKDARNGAGGFGRYIMSKVTDGIEYTFRDGHTVLRMTKRSA